MLKQRLIDILMYVTGSVLFALSVSVFSTPNDIAPGGASGIGIMVHALCGVPVGVVILLLNIPLLMAAFLWVSRSFAWRSAVAIVLSSVIMDAAATVLPPYVGDRLLAAIFGGLLQGLGVGVILLRGASTGGTEVAVYLLQKRWRHLSAGRLMMAVDAVVVATSALVFRDLSAALYAAVQVFVCSVTVDRVLSGQEEGRLLFVVTRHAVALTQSVSDMGRGATVVKATGGYSGAQTALILCAVSRPQLPDIRERIQKVDPAAFVMVVTTRQVVGEGFLPSE